MDKIWNYFGYLMDKLWIVVEMTNGNNLDVKWKYYGNIMERKWKFHDYFEFAIPNYVECRYIESRYTCFYSFQYSYM